jgi:hypothetical protein
LPTGTSAYLRLFAVVAFLYLIYIFHGGARREVELGSRGVDDLEDEVVDRPVGMQLFQVEVASVYFLKHLAFEGTHGEEYWATFDDFSHYGGGAFLRDPETGAGSVDNNKRHLSDVDKVALIADAFESTHKLVIALACKGEVASGMFQNKKEMKKITGEEKTKYDYKLKRDNELKQRERFC